MDADKQINDIYREMQGLMRKLGYEGKGLHEMVTDAEQKDGMDERLVRSCRAVASIRNKHIHEAMLDEPSLEKYQRSAEYAISQLEELVQERAYRERASKMSAAAADPALADKQKATLEFYANRKREADAAKAADTNSQGEKVNQAGSKDGESTSWLNIAKVGVATVALLIMGAIKVKDVIDDFR